MIDYFILHEVRVSSQCSMKVPLPGYCSKPRRLRQRLTVLPKL